MGPGSGHFDDGEAGAHTMSTRWTTPRNADVFDDEKRGVCTIHTLSGPQEMLTVTEAGSDDETGVTISDSSGQRREMRMVHLVANFPLSRLGGGPCPAPTVANLPQSFVPVNLPEQNQLSRVRFRVFLAPTLPANWPEVQHPLPSPFAPLAGHQSQPPPLRLGRGLCLPVNLPGC